MFDIVELSCFIVFFAFLGEYIYMYYVGKIYNWQINLSVNGMELLPDDLLGSVLGME